MRVGAVIVTRDREALLRECLAAVRGQTRPPDEILVVDNASSDGTAAYLKRGGTVPTSNAEGLSHLKHGGTVPTSHAEGLSPLGVLRLERNDGSAGGFAAGLERALAGDCDRFWLLDDDTIPEPGALEALLAGPEDAALLCSRVVWTDGRPHPMNAPWPRWTRPESALAAIERGLLEVRAATYVSILVSRDAVERHGLPSVPYFIWGDDIEFTARLLRDETGFYVPSSVAVHKTALPYAASRSTSDRYAIDVRNKLWMLRAGDVWTRDERPWWFLLTIKAALEYVRFNRWSPRSVATVLRGVRDGLRSAPS